MIKYIIPICAISLTVSLAAPTVLAQQDTLQPEGRPATGVGFSGMCEEDRIQMIRPDGRLACVYPDTAERMGMRGWVVLPTDSRAEPVTATETEVILQSKDVEMHDGYDVTVPIADDGGNNAAADPDVYGNGSDPSLGAGADRGDDNADSPYYDEELYHVGYGKITLEGLRELPNTRGFWSQYTRAHAEDIIMPWLAGAMGDSVILPAGYNGTSTDRYYTEMGNVFLATHRDSNPDIIRNLRYEIRQDIHPNDFEEFVRTFADNAGLDVIEPNIRNPTEPTITLYSADTAGSIYAYNDPFGEGAFVQISVSRWSFDPPPSDWPWTSRTDLTKRAYDFATKHTDIYDEKHCRFELLDRKSARMGGETLVLGIPVSHVHVGNCHDPRAEHDRPWPVDVFIDGVTGETMWPYGGSAAEYLADDWFEKIKHDIPESAWVTDGEGA